MPSEATSNDAAMIQDLTSVKATLFQATGKMPVGQTAKMAVLQ
jgi:hypothetical protein